jgi:hypothetical protein
MLTDVEIAPSSHRHGIVDDDMRHAVRNAIRAFHAEPEGVLLIGPALDGLLLEVIVIDGDTIIHAMTARQKFLR